MNPAIVFLITACCILVKASQEEKAKRWLDLYNKEKCRREDEVKEAEWHYRINMNDETEEVFMNAVQRKEEWDEQIKSNASRFDWSNFLDDDVKEQFKTLSNMSPPDQQVKDITNVNRKINRKYRTAKICAYRDPHNCQLRLKPDITRTMATSRDYDELQWVWEQWRNNFGNSERHHFIRYFTFSSQVAIQRGLKDASELMLVHYGPGDFESVLDNLWEELKPLYMQLHAYTKNRLRLIYGSEVIASDGLIPAHVLGNMWAESWSNIADLLLPFPDYNAPNVTHELRKKKFTAKKMNKLAEDFFTSLGFRKMPQQYWNNSVFERIKGRETDCHPQTWKFFCDENNIRIKMCTDITMEDLVTVHHEIGHVVYNMETSDKPPRYREGPNAGFDEAIGETVALSFSTPKHLHKVGLLEELTNTKEEDLNFLMTMALDKIGPLPFLYLLESFRFKFVRGELREENLNCQWWKFREKYQGVKSPVRRNEGNFDYGANAYAAVPYPTTRYFVALFLQFDFHRSLCIEAGEYDPEDPNKPLHRCDIYNSKEAGKLFSKMLKMGSSKPWSETLEVITGRRTMSTMPVREYFQPLEEWLIEENKKNGEKIGWEEDGSYCSSDGYVPVDQSGSSSTLDSTCILLLVILLVHQLV